MKPQTILLLITSTLAAALPITNQTEQTPQQVPAEGSSTRQSITSNIATIFARKRPPLPVSGPLGCKCNFWEFMYTYCGATDTACSGDTKPPWANDVPWKDKYKDDKGDKDD